MWKADYDPFGEANVVVQQTESNFRFPGQYFDEETGLHQNWYRDYNAALGRYIEADPLGPTSGPGRYIYVGCNPVLFVDAYGLIRWKAVGRGAIGVISGVGLIAIGTGAAASPTGVGQVLGLSAALAGSSSLSYGFTELITGLLDEEVPFSGTKEALIKGNMPPGKTRTALLAANELLGMLPGIAGGLYAPEPSKVLEAAQIVELGLSEYKSLETIEEELKQQGLIKPKNPCRKNGAVQ